MIFTNLCLYLSPVSLLITRVTISVGGFGLWIDQSVIAFSLFFFSFVCESKEQRKRRSNFHYHMVQLITL